MQTTCKQKETTFSNNFSREVWETKYKFGDEKNVDDTFRRVAKALASVEKDNQYWEQEFFRVLQNFQFMTGGRITSNAGTGLTGTTLFNCYTESFTGEDQDSIEGIYRGLYRQAKTLQSEGGYGFCANVMRPRGSNIGGIGNQSPGAVKFLELWDKSSEIITSGSGNKAKKGEKGAIRKGAQMVTLSCWHPDIEEFIEAKKTPGKLTKFNMSVLVTDEFMNAVEQDIDWNLVYPNYKLYRKEYKKYWDGNIEKWKTIINNEDAIIVHKTMKAKWLFELITINTYNRNEPGILFEDTINKLNNLWYIEYILECNPCAEQCMAPQSVCDLGSLNMVHYIDLENKDWNYDKLSKDVPVFVRMLDNANEISNTPLPEQKYSAINKRRIGIGVIGYASALLMMKVRYGSEKALELTEKFMKFYCNELYRASSELAKEKGAFGLFDKEKYLQSNFLKVLDKEVIELIEKHGIRNSHLSSIQPTGNSSVFANNISSGLEPIFAGSYYRTAIQHIYPNGLSQPKNINWENKKYDGDGWSWTKEGDENILICTFNNDTYKIDRNRGLTKEELVEDYGVSYLKKNGEWNENADWAVFADKLNLEDHISPMKIFAKYVDASISKTINIPNNFSYDNFKNVYFEAWKAGLKGCTTYRAGTMTNVLSKESTNKNIDRPKEIQCQMHHITVKGEPYFVLVGLDVNNKPYEIFAGKNGFIESSSKTGVIIKKRKGFYKVVLDDGYEIAPITSHTSPEEDILNRMISISLQHGISIEEITKQLSNSKGDLTNISKGISRVLSKYIKSYETEEFCPDCGEILVREASCYVCKKGCGYSKCG